MKYSNELEGKKVLITQVRSSNNSVKEVCATLSALGLGRIGKEHEHVLNACVFGMLRKVSHLIKVTKVA